MKYIYHMASLTIAQHRTHESHQEHTAVAIKSASAALSAKAFRDIADRWKLPHQARNFLFEALDTRHMQSPESAIESSKRKHHNAVAVSQRAA